MNVAKWNTGRPYTKDGQRIFAKVINQDGFKGVVFKDIDRCIDGYIPWVGNDVENSEYELKEVVMFCYDRGHYQHIPKEIRVDKL